MRSPGADQLGDDVAGQARAIPGQAGRPAPPDRAGQQGLAEQREGPARHAIRPALVLDVVLHSGETPSPLGVADGSIIFPAAGQ
jgi:hypothetical protein